MQATDQRKIIGFTPGDLNGIGPEVIIKTLADARTLALFTPVVYGNAKTFSYYKKLLNEQGFNYQSIKDLNGLNPKQINMVNCWSDDNVINAGQPSQTSGALAIAALDAALKDLAAGKIHGLVTGPVDKQQIAKGLPDFTGHTEYITRFFQKEESLMFLVSDFLRVGLVTNHLPLAEVAQALTTKKILTKLQMMDQSLRADFGITRPKIAVLGLNPHAGDHGLLGNEEETIILPAIQKANSENMFTFGPYPADGFFANGHYRQFDAVLAMYHDQGLIPFKSLTFGSGVNFTAGLPIVRTSPDHGTAFDIAGKNLANPDSLREAAFCALDVIRKREDYVEMTANPLKRGKLTSEENS